jgi:endoglucanase
MLGEHIKDKAVTSAIKASFRVAADNIEYLSKTSGYETAKSINDYGLASNLNSACDCIKLIIANRMLGNDDYINTAVEQLNYLLGKNPNGICFVTGFGSHSVKHPHHRPSIADRCDAPVPGLLVCGPNSERKDEYTKWSIPMDTPPAKCYADNDISFSTNEPAIYYNAALIFVLAYIESLGNADNT